MKKITTLIPLLLGLILNQTAIATESQISLTASDGTGLEMRSFQARIALDGFLAFTELEMVFYNPENRRREGRFQITLPDNAAISRFAMKIGDQLQEGEIVEKQLARRAYEDFLHRRQDPALLETDSGNRFNARIFPIEPKSEKHLILSYSQRLEDLESEYILPLKGLPQLKQLSIKAFYDSDNFSTSQLGNFTGTMSQRNVLSIEKRDYQPTEDFRMPYQPGGHLAMQSEQLVAARIIPFTDASDTQGFEQLIILIDSSASQAPYLSDTLKRLETLLPQLKVGTLLVYTFDQEIIKIGKADNPTAQKALIQQIKPDNALGASRLDAAITTALKLEKTRLLLISDAVITAGESSGAQLAAQLSTMERVDILIPSTHNDKQVARHLAKAGKSPGIVAPLTLSDAHIIRKLTTSVYADIPIKVSGSSWYWPEKVEALQTNEPLIVFAEISNTEINISVGDKNWQLTGKPANPILLKREWVRARIDKLLDMEDKAQDKDMKNAFHNEIIALSVKERVLSPYTSLLVLETEEDYRRYQIDRKGLADILTIGADGITVIKRTGVEAPLPPEIVRSEDGIMAIPDSSMADMAAPELEAQRLEATVEPSYLMMEEAPAARAMMAPSAAEDFDAEPSMDDVDSVQGEVESEELAFFRHLEATVAVAQADRKKPQISPWTGRYADFRALLDKADLKAAGKLAQEWRQKDLTDVMALIALGEWYEKTGDTTQAARAYGSLIDYFPARADIRRWAAERLLSIKSANWLVIDSLKKAVEQRPDHPSGHYLLAIAYWEAEQYIEAVKTLQTAMEREFPRFAAANRILTETLALMLTHLQQRQQLESLFPGQSFNWDKATQRQLRLVLMWETDANDVDFHIYDNQRHHAYYSQKSLPTGGTLYADITTGYGPECFSISEPKAFPYQIQAHYYSKGPMGYGMGVLHVLKSEGLISEFRPFVVMKDGAFVELGKVNK